MDVLSLALECVCFHPAILYLQVDWGTHAAVLCDTLRLVLVSVKLVAIWYINVDELPIPLLDMSLQRSRSHGIEFTNNGI